MDNKFTQIAKIKKQEMDKVETELIQTRFERENIKKKLESLYEEIKNTTSPKRGQASLISMFHEHLKILRREKDDYADALNFLNVKVEQLQHKYKKAHMEFEKIKYLEEEEIKKRINEIKRKEKINMDEIATMLFSSVRGV
ncbi:MAG TPA: hypothetical protein CFH79_06915 [Sulfurospirillum sp. UBA11407]|jgi:flagellar export protein FliJ|nr:MAG TPA: hypothetical protein CFH79_06915 [Sulfurospirillum sp. UBA11407]DAB34521.1 MAG TPA: hypothetical protein CFH82_05005 [Sulfurospirillum sp. UBA12182]